MIDLLFQDCAFLNDIRSPKKVEQMFLQSPYSWTSATIIFHQGIWGMKSVLVGALKPFQKNIGKL